MLFFVKGSLFYLILTLVQRNYIFSDNIRLFYISHARLFLFSFFAKVNDQRIYYLLHTVN